MTAIKCEVIIGDSRLLLGDCLEIMPELGRFDAVIMDPPYNFSTASSGGKHNLWADCINSAFWFSAVLSQCKSNVNILGGAIWQFLNWKTFIPAQKACWEASLKFDSLLVWDKAWIGPGGPIGLRPSYELIAFMALGEFRLPNRGLTDIWRHSWASQRPTGHPAEKPISLLYSLVKETPADHILDPFMGSGTTGIACVKLGRKFTGIEIDPEYFEIACKRVQQAYDQPDLLIEADRAPKPVQEALL